MSSVNGAEMVPEPVLLIKKLFVKLPADFYTFIFLPIPFGVIYIPSTKSLTLSVCPLTFLKLFANPTSKHVIFFEKSWNFVV